MKAKRKRHDPQFKAQVALEALKGIKTVQRIAKEFDLHLLERDHELEVNRKRIQRLGNEMGIEAI